MTSRGVWCAALLAWACHSPTAGATPTDGAAPTATATATDTAMDTAPLAPWTAPFTVRGRWDDPNDISWRAEPPAPGVAVATPVEAADFIAALGRAAAAWNATGVVALRPARAGELADVTFGWRSGVHDDCPPFGRNPAVAHSGPVESGTFVHFDAGRAWESGDDPSRPVESLSQVAAHEWGHVLGLDHVSDPTALMSPDARVATPAAGDVAGLHSLYGGGTDGPGDVHISSASGTCSLRRIAPSECTRVAFFDTDGGGTSELMVLRTDPDGFGALTIYRFGPGLLLSATDGPLLGIEPAGTRTSFSVDAAGARWLVTRTDDGAVVRVRRFDQRGRLVEPSPREVMALDVDALTDGWLPTGDIDGDGVAERFRRS